MGVLKAILWILLGYYLLKIVGRLLRPWAQRYVRRKAEDYFQQASAATGETQGESDRVGEVTIDRRPPARRRSSEKVGEYIEFEDVD
jgi:hypothetical protein